MEDHECECPHCNARRIVNLYPQEEGGKSLEKCPACGEHFVFEWWIEVHTQVNVIGKPVEDVEAMAKQIAAWMEKRSENSQSDRAWLLDCLKNTWEKQDNDL